jgi:hypothetical protein
MRGFARRLAKLERAVSPQKTVHIWAGADAGETADHAIAARFPEGVPDGVTLVLYRWADADQAPADS